VPIRDKRLMLGDNKSVVDNSMQLHAKRHKRHIMLSFHRVREAIAAGIVTFHFLSGDDNPADVLSKHWGYAHIKKKAKGLIILEGRYSGY
jgi:hypothetical protein